MDEKDEKGLVLFGRDVSKMPCFRNSFLYGIGGGIGAGLLFFMFTSRPQMAGNVGMVAFVVTTMSYWTQCRYKYSETKFEMQKLQELMKQHQMYEGTEKESEILKKQSVDV